MYTVEGKSRTADSGLEHWQEEMFVSNPFDSQGTLLSNHDGTEIQNSPGYK